MFSYSNNSLFVGVIASVHLFQSHSEVGVRAVIVHKKSQGKEEEKDDDSPQKDEDVFIPSVPQSSCTSNREQVQCVV